MKKGNAEYDHRNCQSLFGYAYGVHLRSGAICQLCGCGNTDPIDFDLWRQMTVEHLIGKSQGGYPNQILASLSKRFPDLSPTLKMRLRDRINQANTVTACQFCNSVTSRSRHEKTMQQMMDEAHGSAEEVADHVILELESVLKIKRAKVSWKLGSVRRAFETIAAPALIEQRRRMAK